MGTTHLYIADDFDARNIYRNAIFYAKCRGYTDVEASDDPKADKLEHKWEEETLNFIDLKTSAKLTYYSFSSENPKKPLPIHTLEIEVSGEDEAREATIRKLEIITGIKIKRSS